MSLKIREDLACTWRDDALHVTRADGWTAPNSRTVLFLSDHCKPGKMESYCISRFGSHGLWGCVELALAGHRVVMPAVPKFTDRRVVKNVLYDLKPAITHARGLTANDIVYAVHNVLFWFPLLRSLKMCQAHVVGLLFAGEPFLFPSAFDGLLAMTPSAARRISAQAPRARMAHIGWGIELTPHHHRVLPYDPKWGLLCGVTQRDMAIVARVFSGIRMPLRVCARGAAWKGLPPSVEVVNRVLRPEDLVNTMYAGAAYVLVNINADPRAREACGFTNLLEAMALGRPVIVARTGAIAETIDVEQEGVGLFYEPGDANAMRQSIEWVHSHPVEAELMGLRGRARCEEYFNVTRFSRDLMSFFDSIDSM